MWYYPAIVKQIRKYGKRVYEQGFVTATDGNISVRIDHKKIMITSSGSVLGNLCFRDLLTLNFEKGTNRKRKPSSEYPMHVNIYQRRPDVKAVIHAHPPYTTACSIVGKKLSQPLLPEVVVMFGDIPTASYATPSTRESAEVVQDLIADHDAIVLDHHGVVVVGQTLNDAFLKLEKVEHAAKICLLASQVGDLVPLTSDQIEKLRELKKR